MDDDRIWAFEESLWTADAAHYQESVDDACLMVLPEPPYVLTGQQAIDAVKQTPRWTAVELSDRQVARPQEGLIVVAYSVKADKADEQPYKAHCTSTYRRVEHELWTVVQHQQTPPLVSAS